MFFSEPEVCGLPNGARVTLNEECQKIWSVEIPKTLHPYSWLSLQALLKDFIGQLPKPIILLCPSGCARRDEQRKKMGSLLRTCSVITISRKKPKKSLVMVNKPKMDGTKGLAKRKTELTIRTESILNTLSSHSIPFPNHNLLNSPTSPSISSLTIILARHVFSTSHPLFSPSSITLAS